MSSPSTLPLTSFLSSSSATASSAVDPVSRKQLLWQALVFFVVVLVIVAIIAGVVLLIWNDGRIASIRQCPVMKSLGPRLAFIHSPASALVRKMLYFFSTTLLPAFRNLRRATAAWRGGAIPGSELALQRLGAPEFGERQLASPRPAILRDGGSLVPSNPYSVFELSPVPVSSLPRGFPCSVPPL